MAPLTLALSAALTLQADARPQPPEALPAPTRETFNCTADGSCWPYLIQTPEAPQAVVLYLHGHYGDEYQGMAEGSYNDCFGKLRRECIRRQWAYVTTWYGGNTWMGPLAEQGVAELITALRVRWPGVPVYVTGGSMGGSSALVFAHVRPDLVDGVVALCPAGDIETYYRFASASAEPVLANIASAIRIHYTIDGHELMAELDRRSAARHAENLTMPVYIIHGAKDTLIPIDGTRALVERLRALKRPIEYIEQPEGEHDTPVTAVDWPAALDFISAADH